MSKMLHNNNVYIHIGIYMYYIYIIFADMIVKICIQIQRAQRKDFKNLHVITKMLNFIWLLFVYFLP